MKKKSDNLIQAATRWLLDNQSGKGTWNVEDESITNEFLTTNIVVYSLLETQFPKSSTYIERSLDWLVTNAGNDAIPLEERANALSTLLIGGREPNAKTLLEQMCNYTKAEDISDPLFPVHFLHCIYRFDLDVPDEVFNTLWEDIRGRFDSVSMNRNISNTMYVAMLIENFSPVPNEMAQKQDSMLDWVEQNWREMDGHFGWDRGTSINAFILVDLIEMGHISTDRWSGKIEQTLNLIIDAFQADCWPPDYDADVPIQNSYYTTVLGIRAIVEYLTVKKGSNFNLVFTLIEEYREEVEQLEARIQSYRYSHRIVPGLSGLAFGAIFSIITLQLLILSAPELVTPVNTVITLLSLGIIFYFEIWQKISSEVGS